MILRRLCRFHGDIIPRIFRRVKHFLKFCRKNLSDYEAFTLFSFVQMLQFAGFDLSTCIFLLTFPQMCYIMSRNKDVRQAESKTSAS